MTSKDIIAMAHEAQFEGFGNGDWVCTTEEIERFAKLVRDDYSNKHANLWLDRCHAFVLAEREACVDLVAIYGGPVDLEAAIRARGNT